jgi:putative phosphoesterase
VRIGLISDTHGFLDPAVFTYFAGCDEVWHAGDFGAEEILTALRAFKPVRAVYGNIDGPALRQSLPADLDFECSGLRIFMTHIGGYPGNYDPRAKRAILRIRPGLFISGHSHILKVMRDPALDLIHMNPGAAGRHGWHKVRTLLRFTIEGARLDAVEAIELGARSEVKPKRD